MAERILISSGSAFEEHIGYSRAVVHGDWVFVSGCTGYDYTTGTISPDVTEQAEQALRNIAEALGRAARAAAAARADADKAGAKEDQEDEVVIAGPQPTEKEEEDDGPGPDPGPGSMADVVAVRYILPDRADFPLVWPVLRRWFGGVRPAATMIQAGLMEEAMKIEIEVTAVRKRKRGGREEGGGRRERRGSGCIRGGEN